MGGGTGGGGGGGSMHTPAHPHPCTPLYVTVLRARGLRAKGASGGSDAYAVMALGREKFSTSVAERCQGRPEWRQEATFELPPAAASLRLTVLHRALVGLDKFLGRAEVDLAALRGDGGRRHTRWYKLRSKPGKKEKERGEIEVDIQFMRSNMTASMFDLSIKDKSRSPFGKIKDKLKGKRSSGLSDTASEIVPSTTHSPADSEDESAEKEKKKSKFKTLFSKPGLQKTSLSQSMSVLPTHVYMEESALKDNTPASSPSPLNFRRKQLFASEENLSSRSAKGHEEVGRTSPSHALSGSASLETFKSMTLPSYKLLSGEENPETSTPLTIEVIKETKKTDHKKSALLSLVTGKKEAAKTSDWKEFQRGILKEFRRKRKPRLQKRKVNRRPNSLSPHLRCLYVCNNPAFLLLKKYDPSDPAYAYAQLTHDELIQLVLKQKDTISKKDLQVRELEDYIDNLLVRVMEETPNILRVPTSGNRKAGKM
uniref:Rab11 family-interacting protein 1 n=1 Tax=Anas platyrhynchos TaxID=8839 RepID=A0A8B9SW81_ANAPL